jgi:hypothetical protein
MSEENQAGGLPEPELSLEDIEKLFGDFLEQMSAASKKMTLLGKRIREATATENPPPNLEALEQAYLSLPAPRPSWFEYLVEQSEIMLNQSKKFAPTVAQPPTNTQHGHTQ